ncbi:MAG: hypothetical protein ACP5GS_08035 [Nitrososphaeria archaeon]
MPDLLPVLKGDGSRGLKGYSPLAGATPLCITIYERGFAMLLTIKPVAFLNMFNAPLRSE